MPVLLSKIILGYKAIRKMKEEFENLFEYSHYCNQKLIVLFSEKLPRISERSMQLINHLLNAHQIWNARILGENTFQVWQINRWEDLPNIDRANHLKSLEILKKMDFEKLLEYSNSTGTRFSSHLKDILFHIVNHSTYHRAQIAADLRLSGVEPINTDYIVYKREH